MPFYRRAVEIDPKFAIAYANLGMAYGGVGESVLSAENVTRAWQLRDRVSDRERFFIDFTYDRQVTGNLEKAYQTLELWSQTYPRRGATANPQDLLGGISTHGTGRFERAIEATLGGIAADPDFAIPYGNLVRLHQRRVAVHAASERRYRVLQVITVNDLMELPEWIRFAQPVTMLDGGPFEQADIAR